MRFLLLSLLNEANAQLDGNVACGDKHTPATKGHFAIVSLNGCQKGDGSCKGTPKDNGSTDVSYLWWSTAGTVQTSTTTDSCNFPESPLKSKDAALLSDNLWDLNGTANYEVLANAVAEVDTTDNYASGKPTNFDKGFLVFADGEEFSPTIYGKVTAGDPTVLCSKATRKGLADLKSSDNPIMAHIDATATGRCKGGTLDTSTAASGVVLAHNTAGDGAKYCWNLSFSAPNQPPEQCSTDQICDRFIEGSSQCVAKTKQMAAYTKATATANHCTIHKGAGTDDKYRHLDESFASQVCDVGRYCNSDAIAGNGDPVCIEHEHSIGASAKAAARMPGAAVSASNTALKWCIGVNVGAKRCTIKEVCNPHATARADLCINKTDTTVSDGVMDFGAVGAVAPTTGTDKRPFCIGDNAAGSVCGAATVCNYAGGDQSGVAGGDVCLPHTKLLGDIADTSSWTAAAQRKVDGDAVKYCLATDGTTYSSKVCAATEKCNPHASSPADVCIKGITVMNHGDIAPTAADPVADSVRACIGKTFWKLCASENGDIKEVCNEGAGALTEVCISTADCVNPELPKEAFRIPGVEAAEDQKWCFATDGAAKCGLDTLCNPSGVDGGTGSQAICADATKRVPHGEAATEELIHCYGNTGNAVLAEEEDGWLCDEGKGEFIDDKTKMPARSKTEPVTEGEKAVDVCFGKDKVEKCAEGVYCNSMGTETGCTKDGCTTKNICITVESLIEEGEQWVVEGKSICINPDATKGEDCNKDKMYCDQAEGVCSADEIVVTDDPSSGNDGADSTSGCAAQSLAAAAVVAILSA